MYIEAVLNRPINEENMPQHKSEIKRTRQIERRRVRNVHKKSKLRTAIKAVRQAPDKETAATEMKNTVSMLDRMARRGIIHKNKAANLKSKLSKSIQSAKSK